MQEMAGTKNMCSEDKKQRIINKVDERGDTYDEIDMEESGDGSDRCVIVKVNRRRFLPSLAVATCADPSLKENGVTDSKEKLIRSTSGR